MSRSGFYKWRKRGGDPPKDRAKVLRLVQGCHDAHPSHGYRWVHAYLKRSDGITVSAEYVRRCFLYLGIRAETKHQKKDRERKARDPYPNLIFSTWETVDRPRQVIVSDMTAFWTRSRYWELAFYFDVFTKQIIGRGLTKRRGWPGIYHDGLEQAREEIERSRAEAVGRLEAGSGDICVLHTDQGSVYTSKAYNEIIRESSIVRSCSRAGKPTDNPVNESLNGWIKEELFTDFGLYDKRDWEVEQVVDDYIEWYNAKRPCWSLGYMTPNDFYDAFMAGEVERRDTFAGRVIDPTPKFVREKLARAEADAESNAIGTSELLCFDAGVYVPLKKNSSSVYERDADSSSGVHHCHGEDGKSVYEA